ncbi:MAG: hypothetical protein JWM87_4514 [Candidatus Eremiobacteraeota bacterium]|nr:hypothetical protein [Candidatus Eremiobacteraeota bacterium]
MSAEFVSLADLLRAAARPHGAPGTAAQEPRDAAPETPDGANGNAGAANGGAATANAGTSAANANAAGGAHAADDAAMSLGDVGAGLAPLDDVPPLREDDVIAGALRDARLFRARLADAFDDAVARLVRELAADVLARELRLAPAEIATLVRRVLERAPVIRVRVAPADVGFVRGVPVLADPALAPGDAIVELGRGELDARLGVRLAAVLEAFT